MKTSSLYFKVSTRFVTNGIYKVTICYRNKTYSCITCNTIAIDRLTLEDGDFIFARRSFHLLTLKKALYELYNECKRVNNIQ